ncbi:ATP-binding protein [Pedobacter rhizosphaerae]|uniref:ATPase family associated with various cellular activities (AAA) n=1 Tax=Pedobacter rhizosphaerae TaxID=390241 RepID=A0A1H9R2N4_9SPHI|nr:ATP-binding protein [Pedobacter rhizosphaerae]SER66877.1 ATPase family associated with various cellular activities (AAA) [Pedobacter rhizosphaerae]
MQDQIAYPPHSIKANARAINAEMDWLSRLIDQRMKDHFAQAEFPVTPDEIPVPNQSDYPSDLHDFLIAKKLNTAERVILALTIAPEVKPQILDMFFTRNSNLDRGFSEFGGSKTSQHSGFIPTAETAAFLLGTDLEHRFELYHIFDTEHFLFSQQILLLAELPQGEPLWSAKLSIHSDYLKLLTTGKRPKPLYSVSLPAKQLITQLNQQDLIVGKKVREQIREIHNWLLHQQTIMQDWGMSRLLKPGYCSLFYGPPGTGKTLAAMLIAKSVQQDIYRVDLTLLASKYIGETEKNINKLFEKAKAQNWILYFQETEALFGKRTAGSNSSGQYPQLHTAFLRQCIEDYPGLIIISADLKANVDEAFLRISQSIIHFPLPNPAQRLQLWQQALPGQLHLCEDIDLSDIAQEFELSGADIINIIRSIALKSMGNKDSSITKNDLIETIRWTLLMQHNQTGQSPMSIS